MLLTSSAMLTSVLCSTIVILRSTRLLQDCWPWASRRGTDWAYGAPTYMSGCYSSLPQPRLASYWWAPIARQKRLFRYWSVLFLGRIYQDSSYSLTVFTPLTGISESSVPGTRSGVCIKKGGSCQKLHIELIHSPSDVLHRPLSLITCTIHNGNHNGNHTVGKIPLSMMLPLRWDARRSCARPSLRLKITVTCWDRSVRRLNPPALEP